VNSILERGDVERQAERLPTRLGKETVGDVYDHGLCVDIFRRFPYLTRILRSQ
jgi:hypothetical protein